MDDETGVATDATGDDEMTRLPRAAIGYWTIAIIPILIPLMAGGYIAFDALDTETSVAGWIATLPLIAAASLSLFLVLVAPTLRWRRWRYRIRPTDIDLRHGGLIRRQTIIPMNRIQHVEVESGVVMRMFDLAEMTLHTAAGGIEIPALTATEAAHLRLRIAELARLADG